MTTTISTLNSVDVAAVTGLVAAIKEDSDRARTTWKSTVDWKGGFQSESRSRDLDPVPSDEPPSLGGADTAPNPVEQLLAAFGNCLVVGYAANATAAGIELKNLSIELEGDLDLQTFLGLADGNAGFESITANVTIESDAPAEKLEQVHRQVVGTSPVGHTLGRTVPVTVELR